MERYQWIFEAYSLLGPLLVTALGGLLAWVGKRASEWLAAKTKSEAVGLALWRLSDSVTTAVKFVDQTARDELEEAKGPKSPGGARITKGEAVQLKDKVWLALKAEYGGVEGLLLALEVIGLNKETLIGFVDRKIEAAVGDLGRSKADPTKP